MKTAMILAAGRGERLKPLTRTIPKALCKVNNIPLINYHISNLIKAGFEKIIINHAYLGQAIRHYVNAQQWDVPILYSPEPPGGLETGGGIINALPLLGDAPFLTVNADIFTDYAFNTLQLPQNSLAHLVLTKNPSHNLRGDFGLSSSNQLILQETRHTFLGIACYHPDAFHSFTVGRYSVTRILHHLIQQQSATGEFYHGQWKDIGSLERLREVNQFFKN